MKKPLKLLPLPPPKPYPTHRCLGEKQNDTFDGPFYVICTALRMSDNTWHNTCGEPCSFIMQKGGSSYPDWKKEDKE